MTTQRDLKVRLGVSVDTEKLEALKEDVTRMSSLIDARFELGKALALAGYITSEADVMEAARKYRELGGDPLQVMVEAWIDHRTAATPPEVAK